MPFDVSDISRFARDLRTARTRTEILVRRQVNTSLDNILRAAENSAPVRTGELRGSGRVERAGLTGSVVFGSAHAGFVENGTSRMPPEPYLGPAVDGEEDRFYTGVEQAAAEGLGG